MSRVAGRASGLIPLKGARDQEACSWFGRAEEKISRQERPLLPLTRSCSLIHDFTSTHTVFPYNHIIRRLK